ncbi:MAG: ATP-binding cassette domain-containing protein [Firmicutes bacterium]|nr:ATP-binding cassette domain-containing protein [Bacillota bacterium]
MQEIIKTYNLTKRYGKQKAVDNLNINVRKGDIYGLFGLDGAGKTTIVKMLLGLIKPTTGIIEIFGERVSAGRYDYLKRLGALMPYSGFYPNLTVRVNLDIHRRLMGVQEKESIEAALSEVGLLYVKDRLFKSLCVDAKRRVGIAKALLHKPELLILDEPTVGLDPLGVKRVRQLIMDLAVKRQTTILILSANIREIEQLVAKVGIIHQGRILEQIDCKTFYKKNKQYLEIKVDNDKKALFVLEQYIHISNDKVVNPGIIRIYEKLNESSQINRLLQENGVNVSEMILVNETLEEYILKLTGGQQYD